MRVVTLSLAAACAAALSMNAAAQTPKPAAKPAAKTAPAAAAAAGAAQPATAETVKAGAPVQDSAGAALGTVEQPMLDDSGKLTGVAIRSPDGEVYGMPAGGFTVKGETVVAAWTKDAIDQARKAQTPAAAPGQN